MIPAPHFMMHHAPAGAWASLTMGLPGRAVGIDHEALCVSSNADLIVALTRGDADGVAFPFVEGVELPDYEGAVAAKNTRAESFRQRWRFISPASVRRRISACVDEFAAENMALRVITPRVACPDPRDLPDEATDAKLMQALCPAVILELEVDNTRSSTPAHAVIGVAWRGDGRILPVDWSSQTLCGVEHGNRWALAAIAAPDTFTVRDNVIAEHVEKGRRTVHNAGTEGGICLRIPAGERVTRRVVLAFHHQGSVTQGIVSRYWYTRYFPDLYAVAQYALQHADEMIEASQALERQLDAATTTPVRKALFIQSAQSYYANSSALEGPEGMMWSVGEGQFAWRNTLDLAADQVMFEVMFHPFVARLIMDQFLDRYAFRDALRFEEMPGERFPGGLSFAHDQGNYTAYAPAGESGYEMPERSGCYSHMTSEQLLNGIYCSAAYGLRDTAWLKRRAPQLVEMLASLLQRDHPDPAQRTGIMKAQSCRTGERGVEITTYDALDHALCDARGNLYIAVKTWCSALLLARCLEAAGDGASADIARAAAARTADALVQAFDESAGMFPANVLTGGETRVIAAIEALAVPQFCGIAADFANYPQLMDRLARHIRGCLHRGVGIDAISGGLRLSSGSSNTWPSKSILCLFVIERIFGIDLAREYPSLEENLVKWMQVSAAACTLSDQVDSATAKVHGGSYYPRMVTSAMWLT